MYRSLLVLLASVMLIYPMQGQDTRKIPISFLPPPLETATFSLGIYEAKSGKLVRRLKEAATQDAFTVGLNGLITNWDGNDDAGKAVAPGRYAARGYAVGALKVEGERILGNDWTADDETLRVKGVDAIALVPEDEGLGALVDCGSDQWEVLRYDGRDGRLLWHVSPGPLAWTARYAEDYHPKGTLEVVGENLLVTIGGNTLEYRLADGSAVPNPPLKNSPLTPKSSPGQDGSVWKIDDGVLIQQSAEGEKMRGLSPRPSEPAPEAVSASAKSDRLYLLERMKGWQRVRGLSWLETKQEEGKPVSTWQTFFERDVHAPDPALGLDEPGAPVEISLVENPLDPGKPQKVKLQAKVDDGGSYLTISDGLRLRRISQRANLRTAKVVKGKSANSLTFFQNDGAAWDEFSIEGTKNMMAFDAGEIDMTADGEKTHPEKAAEPPDL